jgi:hypothetical protein
MSLWSFQGARELERPPHEKSRRRRQLSQQSRSLKTQQQAQTNVEVDMILGELNAGRNRNSIERVQRLPT